MRARIFNRVLGLATLALLVGTADELNFDPDTPDGLTRAITKLQQRISMAPNGEPTEGLLLRMRKMEDLKPWGSIVYGPDNSKWGISWNHASRRAAVAEVAGLTAPGWSPVSAAAAPRPVRSSSPRARSSARVSLAPSARAARSARSVKATA
ncbi:hypothetical protein BwSH20_56250 [Bradyrhizobium ottawaense]|nr:hypothetical protein SG09_51750 [Bradyrhizobium ottawaense]BBO13030.1 hypothetical protein TM102_45000 [Bradyrhizobium sp. TM102]GMO22626.1 hypothetical protein BwSF12_14940 [Bradyrhizobium ottawaense]GMO77783.1 hypothetical protein BwSF19_25110 [Bradyrhizobium ottawaense]GMO84543.1 hypothetical protein BwSG10_62470 [Bradyrhizobium ottawaense]